jgi:hypothetical protein
MMTHIRASSSASSKTKPIEANSKPFRTQNEANRSQLFYRLPGKGMNNLSKIDPSEALENVLKMRFVKRSQFSALPARFTARFLPPQSPYFSRPVTVE